MKAAVMPSPSLTFRLAGEFDIHRLGYGAMRLTGQPGNFGPYADWEGGKKLLQRAVDLGVNFIDTAAAYGPGTNEDIIRDALFERETRQYPMDSDGRRVIVTTKGGIDKQATDRILRNASPDFLKQGVNDSLVRLGVSRIDLYQLHFPDPNVPFIESIKALKEMKDTGKIQHVGLSNVSLEQLKEAQTVVPVASVQTKYSILDRTHEELLHYTANNAIAFIPYGSLEANPMKRGSPLAASTDGNDDISPLAVLARIAQVHQASTTQIALAWLLHHSPNMVLIPGTTTMEHLEDNMKASSIRLTNDEYAELSKLGSNGFQ